MRNIPQKVSAFAAVTVFGPFEMTCMGSEVGGQATAWTKEVGDGVVGAGVVGAGVVGARVGDTDGPAEGVRVGEMVGWSVG